MKKLEELAWYQELIAENEKRTTLSHIRMGLEAKFGADGLNLIEQINEISDFDKLKEIFLCLFMAQKLEGVQQIL